MSLPFDKCSIRTALIQQRTGLSREDVASLSRAAQDRVLGLDVYRAAGTLALYSPIRNEIATAGLFAAALAAGKRVCYPAVCGDELRFFQVSCDEDLCIGRFGIAEPDRQTAEVELAHIELLLVPGVAFDQRGFRVGYGQGFFDRLLAKGDFIGTGIGFCYDFQLLAQLPTERHDQRVDLLVTDKRIFLPSRI